MNIELLDKARVLISLKNEEMTAYAINIDTLNIKEGECREKLKRILHFAFEQVGLSAEEKSVLVEALPHKEGMFILVTLGEKTLRKTYRIKKPRALPCCKFKDAEALLSCVEHLKSEQIKLLPNSLWLYKNEYYLLFDFNGISVKGKAVLSEYAVCMSASITRLARIREAGKELLKSNATEKIAEAMDEAIAGG